jgi:hypothetical protein
MYTLKVTVMESILGQLHSTHQIAMYGSMRTTTKKSIVIHMPLIRFQFCTFCCALKLIFSGYTVSSNILYMLLFCIE